MSEKYKTYPEGVFHVTLTVVGWIDVFTRSEYCNVVIQNLNYCIEHKELKIFAYCIMPNHIHMIAACSETPLSHILRNFKSHTSKKLIELIQGNRCDKRRSWMLDFFKESAKRRKSSLNYQFWKQGNHPVDLNDFDFFNQRIEYIYNNPIKAGFVDESEEYKYCSFYPGQQVKLEPY